MIVAVRHQLAAYGKLGQSVDEFSVKIGLIGYFPTFFRKSRFLHTTTKGRILAVIQWGWSDADDKAIDDFSALLGRTGSGVRSCGGKE
jgi:hypothetical protein